MINDRDKLFLKLAISNKFLTPDQAEKVISGCEERSDLGIDKSAAEIAVERGFLTAAQSDQLALTVRDLRPPEKIAGFEVQDEIGKGAVGTVYRARQVSLDKVVALKVLHQKHSSNEAFVVQFEREAKAAGKINHPHVVQAIDAGHGDGYHYLAMELVEGRSLKARVKDSGPYTEVQVLALARAIAQGLANAHGHGLLHRDLKPDNILLGNKGEIKIADFGLAMPLDDADTMTAEHKRMGTPFYLSPEQARGESVSEASEIYSLGATLYYAVTSRPPFTGQTLKEILKKQVHQQPVSPLELGASIGPLTDALILDCLAKDPAERIATASQLLERIEAIDRMLTEPTTPSRPAPKSRKAKSSKPAAAPTRPGAGGASRPAVGKASRPQAASAAARPARQGRPSAGREEVLGATPQRTYTKKKSVFTMTGAGLGVLLALVFVLVAAKKNSGEVQQQQEELTIEVDVEVRRKTIDARLASWKKDNEERNRKVLAQLPKIESRAGSTDKLRLAALLNQIEAHPDTAAVDQILPRIDTIRSKGKSALREGVQSYFDDAARLEAEGRYFDALMALDRVPPKLLREKIIDREVGDRIKELSDRIDLEYRMDQIAVKESVGKKDYIAAIAILKKIVKYADEIKAREAETQLVQLEQDKTTVAAADAARRVQEENDKYIAMIAKYKPLAEARNFADCVTQAVILLEETSTATVKAQLESDLQAFGMLDQFINGALDWYSAQEATGKEITLEKKNEDKIVGTSVGFEREAGKVTLKIRVKRGGGEAVQFIALDDINDATLFSFAEEKHGLRSAAFVVPLGVLFTYRQRFDIAARHFALAKEAGIAPDEWLTKLEFFKKHNS